MEARVLLFYDELQEAQFLFNAGFQDKRQLEIFSLIFFSFNYYQDKLRKYISITYLNEGTP